MTLEAIIYTHRTSKENSLTDARLLMDFPVVKRPMITESDKEILYMC